MPTSSTSLYFKNTDENTNAIEALLDELSRTQAIIKWLALKLDKMARDEPDRFSTVITREIEEGTKPLPFRSGAVYTNVLRRELIRTEEQQHPLLVWYLREREHLVKLGGLLVSLSIKLEQVELSRRQADLIVTAMHHLTHALGHDPGRSDIAQLIVDSLELVAIADDEHPMR